MRFSLIVLSLFLMLFSFSVFGRSYYISNHGSDSNKGTSETNSLKSISKVNQIKLSDGDSILFHRGETFYGTLIINGKNITVSGYGNNEKKPVLSGSSKLNKEWVYNKGLWEYYFSGSKPTEIRGVIFRSERLPVSRMPNKDQNHGYLAIDKIFNNDSFSGGIQGSWSGSELIIRTERFRLVHSLVKQQNGQVLNITRGPTDQKLRVGFAFFFVNSINAIDKDGEWAYNKASGKLYIKQNKSFPINDLSVIKQNYCIEVNNSNFIRISNVKIEYAGRAGIKITNSSELEVQNVEFQNIVGNALTISNSKGIAILDNFIDRVAWSGISIDPQCSNATVIGNTIRNVGEEEFAVKKTFVGIDCNASLSRIEKNNIKNTGYAGIISAGKNNLIKKNIIDSVCLLLNDNGGIYLNNNINDVGGSIVEENFISHAVGELVGAPSSRNLSNGIYLDINSHDVTVRNNTITDVNGSGIFINYTKGNIKIHNNIVWKSKESEIYIAGHTVAPHLKIFNNILVAPDKPQKNYHLISSIYTAKYSLEEIGDLKGNIFLNEDYPSSSIKISFKGADHPPLKIKEMQALFGIVEEKYMSVSTKGMPKLVSNKSDKIQKIDLSGDGYKDTSNNSFNGHIELLPFQSKVLFRK